MMTQPEPMVPDWRDVDERASTEMVPVKSVAFDLGQANPQAAFERAAEVVQYMAAKCTGPAFIARIQGRMYPRVEWWTTVGSSLGLFPREVSSERFPTPEGYGYKAVVEVCHGGNIVTRASAICTTAEKAWGARDEYAVKSMATTRATGKAYRIGLSSLAVMAGLEPTPADEVPPQGFDDAPPKRTPARSARNIEPLRKATLRALDQLEQNRGAQPALIARLVPALAGKASGDYTFADWRTLKDAAEAALKPQPASPATPGATPADLPWEPEPPDDADEDDAEAEAMAKDAGW